MNALYVYFGKEKRICACLLLDDKFRVLSRGLSFCSKLDRPTKVTARQIANNRAIEALQHATSDESSFGFLAVTRPEVEAILESAGIPLGPDREVPPCFKFKAEYRPQWTYLSEKERAVLYGWCAGYAVFLSNKIQKMIEDHTGTQEFLMDTIKAGDANVTNG